MVSSTADVPSLSEDKRVFATDPYGAHSFHLVHTLSATSKSEGCEWWIRCSCAVILYSKMEWIYEMITCCFPSPVIPFGERSNYMQTYLHSEYSKWHDWIVFWRCHLSFFYLLHFLSFVSSSTLRVICIVWSVKYRMSVSVEEELQFSVESPVENVRKEVLETKHTHPCRSSATCLWSSWQIRRHSCRNSTTTDIFQYLT